MKIGIQLPEVEWQSRWVDHAAMVTLIEEAGFDSIWVGDHLLYDEPARGPWEAWTQLAAIAAMTRRVEIGPLVAATAFHAPAVLAKMASTVDEISGGRLILGLGAGWNRREFEAFGLAYDYRVSRFEEAFEIIRRLVAGETVTFSGSYYEITDAVLLPPSNRPGGPPLMLGSHGDRMLQIAAPYMDMWNSWYAWHRNDPALLAPIHERVDAALIAAGRAPSDVTKTGAALVGFAGGRGRLTRFDRDKPTEPITGTPEQIAGQLREWGAAGVDHLQLVLDAITVASIEEAALILPWLA